MRSRKGQCQAPPDNTETGDTYVYNSRERRSCVGQKIVQNTTTYTGVAAAAAVRAYTYICMPARPISTNPRFMEEECEYGLPSACFSRRRFEVAAVAGLLWMYFVECFLVFGGISFLFSFSLLRTCTAYCTYEVTLPDIPVY